MKDFLKLAGTLCIITFLAAALLCGVNAMTEDQIAANAEKKRNDAMNAILTSADSFTEVADGIFEGTADGQTVGYCVTSVGIGYGGEVSMMVGINTDYSIAGIEILSHGETAGLGANCTNDSFKSQFSGKEYPLVAVKGAAATNGQISAITGATITSRAVVSGVNNAIERLEDTGLMEGGAQ